MPIKSTTVISGGEKAENCSPEPEGGLLGFVLSQTNYTPSVSEAKYLLGYVSAISKYYEDNELQEVVEIIEFYIKLLNEIG